MASRYFDKTKPMPAWLAEDRPNADSWTNRYYRRLRHAQPVWADVKAIKRIYDEAHKRRQRGEWVVVDHIMPLHGTDICGLHVPGNLRIITYAENSYLSNTIYPGQPCQQLELFQNWHAPIDFELEPLL